MQDNIMQDYVMIDMKKAEIEETIERKPSLKSKVSELRASMASKRESIVEEESASEKTDSESSDTES